MLAVLTTHPIQYQVPIWKALAARRRVPFKVFYMSDQGLAARHDPGFARAVAWDIDLLAGYDHQFVDVVSGSDRGSFWSLRLKSGFGRQLKSEGFQVLWTQGWQVAAYWQAVWQARGAGLQTWLRAETNLRSTGQGWLRVVKALVLAHLLRRIDTFLCIGEANRQFYLSRGIPPSRLASAPYCVENERFTRQAEAIRSERSALRAKWCIPPNAACILFAGKLIQKKRPLDLVGAARILKARLPDRLVHLLFVGTGELLETVRAECRIAHDFEGASDRFATDADRRVDATFAGFLNQGEIAKAYVAADCLTLPSEATETWGLVVNEAMACGLPAVVSDGCGCSDDLVLPVRADICFPLGDISALADSLQSCLERPPSEVEIRTVIDRYDVMRTVETVERLYLTSVVGAARAS